MCIVQFGLTGEDAQSECNPLYNERDGCWRDPNENDDSILSIAIASDRVCFGSDTECCEASWLVYVLWIGGSALLIWTCVICCCCPGCGACNGGCGSEQRYDYNPATRCCKCCRPSSKSSKPSGQQKELTNLASYAAAGVL